MPTLNVCVEIYMNKRNTKFIQITNIPLIFRSFVNVLSLYMYQCTVNEYITTVRLRGLVNLRFQQAELVS